MQSTDKQTPLDKCFICSAIIGEDGKTYVGARHGHCLKLMRFYGVKQKGYEYQGFMLGDGSFINREDGLILARETNQLNNNLVHGDILYSENLR